MTDTASLRRIVVASVVSIALAVAVAVPSRAQDRETLWTKVSAEGRAVVLAWDKSHPWDAALSAGGAELVARYFVDARREVSESLVKGVVRKGDRTLRFELPASMRGAPVGPVCLFVQMPDRRALPVRRAGNQDGDTVGFRYEAWERQARQAGETRAAQERVTMAERASSASARNIAGKEASIAQRGWTGPASCDQVGAPSAVLGPKPFDVVAPADQDGAARRVCVNRVVNGFVVISEDYVPETLPKLLASYAESKNVEKARSSLSAVYSAAFSGPLNANPAQLINAVVSRLGADNGTVKARQAQTAGFLADWSKWTPTLKDYRPELGSPTEYLGWPSTAEESAFRVFGPDLARELKAEWAVQGMPAPTVRDLESFLGSALDAYSGCVDDSAKQLKTKNDNWEALRSSAPQRAASAREFLVRECRQEVGALETMKAERQSLQQELTRGQQALAAASAPIPLAEKPLELNRLSCAKRP